TLSEKLSHPRASSPRLASSLLISEAGDSFDRLEPSRRAHSRFACRRPGDNGPAGLKDGEPDRQQEAEGPPIGQRPPIGVPFGESLQTTAARPTEGLQAARHRSGTGTPAIAEDGPVRRPLPEPACTRPTFTCTGRTCGRKKEEACTRRAGAQTMT